METLPANASEFGVSGGDAEPSSVLEPGQDRRRKKQATKRMEQLIKIHTETLELSDVSGNVDVNTDMGPSWDQQQQTKLVRTLDRTDPRGRHTRLHKRSILKH